MRVQAAAKQLKLKTEFTGLLPVMDGYTATQQLRKWGYTRILFGANGYRSKIKKTFEVPIPKSCRIY